ncbi:MAG: hypothetical protein L0241_16570 [Planctomycetia bacterium]|nr:hypothetical protein [Planctomycetia bacterium]
MPYTFCAAILLATLSSDEFYTARLDRLLALHQEYGLPLHPPDTQLVRFVSEDSGVVGFSAGKAQKSVFPRTPRLGFSRDGRTVLGHFNEPGEVESIAAVKPDPRTLAGDVELGDLLLAIQCHARGWTSLSRAAYRRWLAEKTDWAWGEDYLAWIAWEHWIFRLSYDPGTPLPLVAKHLKRILPDTDPEEDIEARRELIRSLELALVQRNSRPGSDEALIDDLIHVAGNYHGAREIKEPRTNPHYESVFRTDPRYRALLRRGFAAVPALIDHLADERLTRLVRYTPVFNRLFETYHCRVKDVVLDLLEELAGEPLVDDNADGPARVKAVRKWFAEAQKLGEEESIVSRVLGPKDKTWFRDTLFWLLCDKYPKRVPEVYRDLIDKHRELADRSWQFAEALAHGPLPVADKRKILEFAARQVEPHHRVAGVKFLRLFDAKQADELLLSGLERLSSRPSGGEMTLVELAAERDDPREWQALAKAVRRAEVEWRIRLLMVIAEERAPESLKKRLAFLAEYLTDDALCDKADERQQHRRLIVADTDFARLEVRNFAALGLAQILQFDDEPHNGWSAAQWTELREKVRAKVKEELER